MGLESANQSGGLALRFILEPLERRLMLSASNNRVLAPAGTEEGSLSLSATMGQQFNGVVAEFNTSDLGSLSGDTQGIYAEINWGDGSQPDFGVVEVQGDGTIDVSGQHTYQFDAGASQVSENITVALGVASVTQNPAAQFTDYVYNKVNIAVPSPDPNWMPQAMLPLDFFDQPSTGTDFDVPSSGQYSGIVAVSPPSASPYLSSNAYAVIDWGDGTVPQFAVVQSDSGYGSDVVGSHDYAQPGTYQVRVTVFTYSAQLENPWQIAYDVYEDAIYSAPSPAIAAAGTFGNQALSINSIASSGFNIGSSAADQNLLVSAESSNLLNS